MVGRIDHGKVRLDVFSDLRIFKAFGHVLMVVFARSILVSVHPNIAKIGGSIWSEKCFDIDTSKVIALKVIHLPNFLHFIRLKAHLCCSNLKRGRFKEFNIKQEGMEQNISLTGKYISTFHTHLMAGQTEHKILSL